MKHNHRSPMTLDQALDTLKVDLRPVVAACGYWAPPEAFKKLKAENGDGTWYARVRRHKVGGPGRIGKELAGVWHDNNTFANTAIKQACGFKKGELRDYVTCHIWPLSTYDIRYHTCIANLVLLPRALASLSDHDDEPTAAALRYRAFELYGWKPEDEDEPQKPDAYPKQWCIPSPFNSLIEKRLMRRERRA